MFQLRPRAAGPRTTRTSSSRRPARRPRACTRYLRGVVGPSLGRHAPTTRPRRTTPGRRRPTRLAQIQAWFAADSRTNVGTLVALDLRNRGVSGRLISVTLIGANGTTKKVSGDVFRSVFNAHRASGDPMMRSSPGRPAADPVALRRAAARDNGRPLRALETLVTIAAGPRFRTQAFIDGRFVDAASGETFATENPANGEVIAHVQAGGSEDIDRAVAAARRSFEDGRWSRQSPADRKKVLLRFAALIEANTGGARDARFARGRQADHRHPRGRPAGDGQDVHLVRGGGRQALRCRRADRARRRWG